MPNRSAIPAEVRRAILVEAGHRCAIQTCRSAADVDAHHIVPWRDSPSHHADNLIALCPNCHRRADRGDIDRESLRKYKRICQALARPPQAHNEAKTFIKFSPESPTTILDASNISSLADIGNLDVGIGFGEPFPDNDYVITASGSGFVSFEVIAQTKDYVHLRFRQPCPRIVRLQFNE